MRLKTTVPIDAPPDRVFDFLTDVRRVGACMPGATLTEQDGEDFRGAMVVRVGPITASYDGRVRFLEMERDERRVVMKARADERNGQGNAEARIASTVAPRGEGSVVEIDTDLQIRGRIAQFGRAGIETVADRVIAELGRNVERALAAGDDVTAAPAAGTTGTPEAAAPAELDLGRAMLGGAARRYAAPALALGAAVALGYLAGTAREARRAYRMALEHGVVRRAGNR
jgi:uncharacterized protein